MILARDINDDGQLDLVVVNAFTTVALLYGNSNWSFQICQYFSAVVCLRLLVGCRKRDSDMVMIVSALCETAYHFREHLRRFARHGTLWSFRCKIAGDSHSAQRFDY
jgi:hypothetical protein